MHSPLESREDKRCETVELGMHCAEVRWTKGSFAPQYTDITVLEPLAASTPYCYLIQSHPSSVQTSNQLRVLGPQFLGLFAMSLDHRHALSSKEYSS